MRGMLGRTQHAAALTRPCRRVIFFGMPLPSPLHRMPRTPLISPLSAGFARRCAVMALALFPLLLAAQRGPAKPAAPAGPPPPPFASLLSEHVIILPVQLLAINDATPIDQAKWPAFRKELDDSIGSVVAGRGIGKKWWYAADVVRSARRNSAYTSDPYALGAAGHSERAVIKPGDRPS